MSNASRDELYDRFYDDHEVRYEARLVIDNEPVRTISDAELEVVQSSIVERQLYDALDEYVEDNFKEDV